MACHPRGQEMKEMIQASGLLLPTCSALWPMTKARRNPARVPETPQGMVISLASNSSELGLSSRAKLLLRRLSSSLHPRELLDADDGAVATVDPLPLG